MVDHSLLVERPVTSKTPTVTYELYRTCEPTRTGAWCVGSVRYSEDAMTHEIKFQKDRELSDVVGQELSAFFGHYLPVEPKIEVICAKDAFFEKANVVVRDIRMTAFKVKNSVQRCIIIVNEFKGHLLRNMSESSFIMNIFQMRDSMISKVIGDVLLPIVNLGNLPEDVAMDSTSKQRVQDFMDTLRTENGRLTACLRYLLDYMNDSPNNPVPDRRQLH